MAYVVDFRSDTVTKPCADMRQAMFDAEVGDDVWGDDPTVQKLEATVAELLGKESALFLPTGTMSNLVAMMAHCQGRGEEVLLGDLSHILLYEQGGIAQLAGVMTRTLANQPDGTFDLAEAESKIRMEDIHFPRTRVICIEDTHNFMGGKVLPMDFVVKVRELADKHNLQVHLDGARLMNAVIAMGTTPDTVTKHCDSISLCLSKGLGAPVGSCLAGKKDFIKRAHRHRKALGGGMRQVGVLAAAGLVALEKGTPRLKTDHENAKLFTQGVIDLKCQSMTCDPSATETNMVFLQMAKGFSPQLFYQLSDVVTEGEEKELGQGIRVRMCPISSTCIRAVFHHHISKEDVAMALKKLAYVDRLMVAGDAEIYLPKN